jgi:hypothetical protein
MRKVMTLTAIAVLMSFAGVAVEKLPTQIAAAK